MERLNSALIKKGGLPDTVLGPATEWDSLPVKIVQFGTGVLLRGLPDYFVDKANRQGVFNGRIAVVKSTGSGKTDGFEEQDGLYTLCVKGITDGKDVEEYEVNAAIKEVLAASERWNDILRYAEDTNIRLVISNTTEVGIAFDKHDSIFNHPPQSFPGKLLAFLYRRYQHFGNDPEAGLVILPTELISDNGKKLKDILILLAEKEELGSAFISWLTDTNEFCNTLVDRIVPGKLPYDEHQITQQQLGYRDELLIMAEPFRLWAIEAKSPKVAEVLTFSSVDDGMVITSDIRKFKELKLRLLNGTHTLTCGLAVLAGFETVKEAMADPAMESFIRTLLLQEIVPAVASEQISFAEAADFAERVLDRFRNRSLDHKWINITLNYTSKMEMRNVALLKRSAELLGHVPDSMALGFAAYILFMKGKRSIDHTFRGYIPEKGYYPINDGHAEWFEGIWHKNNLNEVVRAVLNEQQLWKSKLSELPGFEERVAKYLTDLTTFGASAVIEKWLINKQTQTI